MIEKILESGNYKLFAHHFTYHTKTDIELSDSDYEYLSDDKEKDKLEYKDLSDYKLEINLKEFEIGEKRLFIKIISNEVYDKSSVIKLELENKLDIKEYEVIHNHENCYFLN